LELEIALLLKMGAVFLLLFCVLWALRHLLGHTAPRGRGLIRIVEARAIAQGQTLYLVQVGQQSFLLGRSKESLTFLTLVEDLPQPEKVASQDAVGQSSSGKVLEDWRKACSRWPAFWRGRFHIADCRSSRSSTVDQT